MIPAVSLSHGPHGALSIAVETERLKIISVTTDEYTEPLVDLYGSKEVNALVGSGSTQERDQVVAKIERWKTRWSHDNPTGGFVIVEKATGDFVGQIILKAVKDKTKEGKQYIPGQVEIGYLSVKKHWGKKYCQEYSGALLDHLIPALIAAKYDIAGKPLSSVMATARVDNGASNAVLRKFMTYTGTAPRYNGPREWYIRSY